MVNYINAEYLAEKMPKRPEKSNKYTFGRILNIAGSKNYTGAAYLSSISALKIGAGYLTLACIDCISPVIASMAPEITFLNLIPSAKGVISSNNKIDNLNSYDVISLGCGLGTDNETKEFIFNILSEVKPNQKLIIDADGINILAGEKFDFKLSNAVITPHFKELSRFLNVSVEKISENREKYARITSQTYDCITVLKGYNTVVTDGGSVFINTTGSSALAKAGTGDVLTGIISGLAAQKVSTLDSALLGVYLHGLSGDIAADDLTPYCVMASDILDYLPLAVHELLYDNQVL